MDDREKEAVVRWLGLEEKQRREAVEEMDAKPLDFVSTHLDLLPPHLLLAFANVISPQERGRLARIRGRRRNWARQMRPDELSVEEARRRDPLLYKEVVATMKRRRGARENNSRLATSAPPPPPSQPPLQRLPLPSSSVSTRLVQPEDVERQQRFAAIVERLDEEEVLMTLRKQQGRLDIDLDVGQEVEEEEEGEEEEEDEDSDEGTSREDDFRDEVLDRFVRGDPNLPFQLYHCDFDDRWDTVQTSHSSSEEKWFEDDED